MSFIFADLIIIPIILIYRKYYAVKAALRITAIFYGAMVLAEYAVELLFMLLGLVPHNRHLTILQIGISWNCTTWLGDFDFDANPNTINTLATGDWVRRGQSLCLIGDSGTGKSHLLLALGTAAAEKGFRVKYTLATRLVNELVEAADEKNLARTTARYGRVDLLMIDELGYLELDRRGAGLLALLLWPERQCLWPKFECADGSTAGSIIPS